MPGRAARQGLLHTQALWFLCGQMTEGEPVRHVPIYSFPFRVGRRGDVSLSLPFKTISSLHAEIVESGPSLVLREYGEYERHVRQRPARQRRVTARSERPRAVRRRAVSRAPAIVGDGGMTVATASAITHWRWCNSIS